VPFRTEYLEAMKVIARVFDHYEARTQFRPILVGGAAVEYYTGGDIVSGGFDVIAPDEPAFSEAMLANGFQRENRPGHVLRGWYHDALEIGVELVSGPLFEGRTDHSRIPVVLVEGSPRVRIPPIEDLIADRLAQFEASDRRDQEMLNQAHLLFQLAEDVDSAYLERRISEEGADPALLHVDADSSEP
jgi:hypothetical protein